LTICRQQLLPAVLDKAPHFDVVLTMYNLTMGPELGAAIDSAARAGLGVVAMKSGRDGISESAKLAANIK